MLEISKVITISTAHITQETAKKLDDKNWNKCCLSIYDKEGYGWWIFIPEYYTEDCTDIPEDLHSCVLLAINNNCEWLCLDCDGQEVDGLKTYEW